MIDSGVLELSVRCEGLQKSVYQDLDFAAVRGVHDASDPVLGGTAQAKNTPAHISNRQSNRRHTLLPKHQTLGDSAVELVKYIQ